MENNKDKNKPVVNRNMSHGLNVGGDKPKEFKKTLSRLLKYLKPFRTVLLVVIFLAILGTLFSVLGPYLIGEATNVLKDGLSENLFNFKKLAIILGIALGLYIISNIFNFLSSFLSSKMSQKVVYNLRNEVKFKLNKIPLRYFDDNASGDILSKMTNDIETIATTLQQSIVQIISSVVTLLGVLTMMFIISPLMTMVSFLALPIFGIITFTIAKFSQKQFANQQKYLGQLNGNIEEIYNGHKVVKLFNHEEKAIDEFLIKNEKLAKASTKAQFLSGIIMPALNFVNNCSYVAIVFIGAILTGQGTIKLGNILAFIQYSKQFAQPILQTANIANVIQSTIAAAERVFAILDEQEEIENDIIDIDSSSILGNVTFNNVSFSYSKDTKLIENLNLTVKAGSTIAIVGPTGAGKTTLVNLLMRFYEIDGGKILIDGYNAYEMSRNELRNNFAMVLQDTWLFAGTIKDNVKFGRPNATDDEVIEACKKAHVHHFIKTMPDGYNTILSEDAINISQGQKQLLTIARAILCDSKILILDEATSSVDTRTESYIQNAMTAMMVGKTSFVIAHRLSTIKNANSILVMNKGTVIEQGSHDELIKAQGFYYNLYNSQFTHNA